LRRWLPRQSNIDDLADEDLQEIVMTYNLTPRKCLGPRIQNEVQHPSTGVVPVG
jgi:IS30 family transposase